MTERRCECAADFFFSENGLLTCTYSFAKCARIHCFDAGFGVLAAVTFISYVLFYGVMNL